MPVISQIGTLQHVYIDSLVTIPFYENDIIDLHLQRLNQNRSSSVTVYLFENNIEFNAIIPENSLVLIKICSDFESNKPRCMFNPFNHLEFKAMMTYLNPKIDCSL